MNVAFNPSVNFKSDTNLIGEAQRKVLMEKRQAEEESFKRSFQLNDFPAPEAESTEKTVAVEKTPADKFEKELTDAELNERAGIFAQKLKNRKWKKEYLPENDLIIVRQKHVNGGIEYMMKNDGTVMETGLKNKALVIIEPNLESAKTFAKYKKKLDPNAPKTSFWMKCKEAVANVWKFFAVAGTMGVATARGLWQGTLTGAGVLAIAVLTRGTVKAVKNEAKVLDIMKSPLKSAGTTGKVLALAAGALVLTGHLIAGKLEANQKSSVIEHKIDVPHEND